MRGELTLSGRVRLRALRLARHAQARRPLSRARGQALAPAQSNDSNLGAARLVDIVVEE
jgi:hypothetical protein